MRGLVVLLALVVGCNRYDEEKLRDVCAKGSGYVPAAPYDANAAANPYPLAIVYKAPHVGGWFFNTPERFRAATAAPSKENHQNVALALCVEQQPGPFDRDCEMDSFDSKIQIGGGTPKVDVKKSARGPTTIKAYGSHYILSMRETKTGKVLATKTLDVKVEHCPLVTLGGYADDYADIREDDLVAFAASALPKAVAARLAP